MAIHRIKYGFLYTIGYHNKIVEGSNFENRIDKLPEICLWRGYIYQPAEWMGKRTLPIQRCRA